MKTKKERDNNALFPRARAFMRCRERRTDLKGLQPLRRSLPASLRFPLQRQSTWHSLGRGRDEACVRERPLPMDVLE